MRTGTGHRALDRAGHDLTVRNFTQSGEDDYGDPLFDETDEVITARLARGTAFNVGRSPAGDELEAEYTVLVKDTVDITDKADNGKSTEFIDGSDKYRVVVAQDQRNGVIACLCQVVT